jgi:predicted PurR-regulated permease PerM
MSRHPLMFTRLHQLHMGSSDSARGLGAMMSAVVSILPLLGSALGWGLGAATLALQGRYDAATVLVVIGMLVASNIDNVTRPLVNRRMSQLHPMTTLVAAFAGVSVLGLPGVLFGPLAISYFFELVRLYAREYPPRASPDSRAAA